MKAANKHTNTNPFIYKYFSSSLFTNTTQQISLCNLSLYIRLYIYIDGSIAAIAVNMYVFRSEMAAPYTELEKRQLFLRSYQFSRKLSVSERINKSFFRVRKSISLRLRSARKLRKMLWFKLKNGFFFTTRRRRFFLRLHNYNYNYSYNYAFSSPQYSC